MRCVLVLMFVPCFSLLIFFSVLFQWHFQFEIVPSHWTTTSFHANSQKSNNEWLRKKKSVRKICDEYFKRQRHQEWENKRERSIHVEVLIHIDTIWSNKNQWLANKLIKSNMESWVEMWNLNESLVFNFTTQSCNPIGLIEMGNVDGIFPRIYPIYNVVFIFQNSKIPNFVVCLTIHQQRKLNSYRNQHYIFKSLEIYSCCLVSIGFGVSIGRGKNNEWFKK